MLTGLGALSLLAFLPAAGRAQDKAPLYSFIANWEVAREKFKDIEAISTESLMAKHLANGDIVGYGRDITLVHKPGESTHDNWFSSKSWAGLIKTLEDLKAAGVANASAFAGAKHDDKIYVSRHYNWKAGSFKDGYTRVSEWKLKPTAPEDAVEQMAKNFIVPMLEKLLSEGAIYEYEIDQEAIHQSDPATFSIVTLCKGPEGLDKLTTALGAAMKSSAFSGAAFGSWMDSATHKDWIASTTGSYK
jgi:hypothetical protein